MEEQRSVNWGGILVGLVVLLVLGILVGTREAPPSREGADSAEGLEQLQTTTVLSTLSYQGEDGKNALELLQASHQVEIQESDVGAFVTAIDGVGSEENAYWLYYIDGEPAAMAADKYETKAGQQIEWRYEQF